MFLRAFVEEPFSPTNKTVTSQTLYLYEIYKVETSKSAHSNMFFINQILRYYPPGKRSWNRGWWCTGYWGGYVWVGGWGGELRYGWSGELRYGWSGELRYGWSGELRYGWSGELRYGGGW
jgi:hypothetical protein